MSPAFSLWPHRLPNRLRAAGYALAVAVLSYLCLAPAKALPQENIWDKAEHSISWFVLAAIGLAFWPWRPGRVTAFALAFGALIEVLQATMPFGRDGDWHDWMADSVGVAAALVLWAAIRALAGEKMLPRRERSAKR